MESTTARKKTFRRPFRVRLAIGLLVGIALAPACGPSQQEIMAREQARIEAEARRREAAEAKRRAAEARRQAEAARQEKMRAAEAAAAEAARQGRFGEALAQYREVLKSARPYGEQDRRVRHAAIKAAQAMGRPPALSDDVLRYLVRGEARLKLGGAGSFEAAAQEMEQAVLEAPWFGDGYFNLATVQDKAGRYGEAMRNYELYLLAAPQSRNAAAVRAKIFELEVLQEDAIKTVRLMGNWRDLDDRNEETNAWGIRVKGGRLVVGNNFMHLEKKGLALEGIVEFAPSTSHNCTIPGAKRPVTGTISADGTRVDLDYEVNNYSITYQGNVCLGVAHAGMKRETRRLVFERPCPVCVDTEALTAAKARSLGVPPAGGLLVTHVYEGGPGDAAGLKAGDVIVACQGTELPDDTTFTDLVRAAPVGSDIPLTFLRQGEEHDVMVKAGVYRGK